MKILVHEDSIQILGNLHIAAMKNNKWGILDDDGKQLLPHIFDMLEFNGMPLITNEKSNFPQCNLEYNTQVKSLQKWILLSDKNDIE